MIRSDLCLSSRLVVLIQVGILRDESIRKPVRYIYIETVPTRHTINFSLWVDTPCTAPQVELISEGL